MGEAKSNERVLTVRKSIVLFAIIGVIISMAMTISSTPNDPLLHDTERWAVVADVNDDRMAVEPTDDAVWAELVQMNQQGTQMWVGGIVERYDSAWGFRFRPSTVTVAEVTAEGLQATIEFISSDIGYWENLGWAYVSARVVEVNP